MNPEFPTGRGGLNKIEKCLQSVDLQFHQLGVFLTSILNILDMFGTNTSVGGGVMTSSRFFPMILVYF